MITFPMLSTDMSLWINNADKKPEPFKMDDLKMFLVQGERGDEKKSSVPSISLPPLLSSSGCSTWLSTRKPSKTLTSSIASFSSTMSSNNPMTPVLKPTPKSFWLAKEEFVVVDEEYSMWLADSTEKAAGRSGFVTCLTAKPTQNANNPLHYWPMKNTALSSFLAANPMTSSMASSSSSSSMSSSTSPSSSSSSSSSDLMESWNKSATEMNRWRNQGPQASPAQADRNSEVTRWLTHAQMDTDDGGSSIMILDEVSEDFTDLMADDVEDLPEDKEHTIWLL